MASSNALLLDPRDQEELLARQELVQIDAARARVSRRRLENRSSESTESAPSSIFSSVDTVYATSSPIDNNDAVNDSVVTVPMNFECAEFLQFIGFEPITASMLHQRWKDFDAGLLNDFCDNLFDFTQHWIDDSAAPDVTAEGDDWDAFLSAVGVNSMTKQAIMDPSMKDIRLTASGKFWVQSTMQDRWYYLKGAQQRSSMRAAGNEFNFAVGSGALPAATGAPAGVTVLWKGVAVSRAERVFKGPHRQKPIYLNPVVSLGTGDYHRNGPLHYFSTQVETAQKFAQFVRNCGTPVPACLLRIEVPNAILESYGTYALTYPSDDFKQVVWHSRRGDRLPRSLSSVSQAQLLVGDICTLTDRSFHNMQHHSEIDERHLLKVTIDGIRKRARQHAFRDELAEKIEEACQDTIQLRKWDSPDEAVL